MKKILWICKESFTGPINSCLSEFQNYENEALFIHPTESVLQDKTYVNFKKINSEIIVHDLNSVFYEFGDNSKNKFDYNLLQKFLNKYSDFFGLDELLMSSQIFTTPYHNRFYFKDISDNEKYYWIYLLFNYFEKLLINSKPDFIFDLDNSEIGRSVLWLVSKKLNIPYITIEHTRYDGYLIPNFSLGRRNDDYFTKELNNSNPSPESVSLVQEFKLKSKIINPDYNNNKTSKIKNNYFLNDIKKLIIYVYQVLLKYKNKLKLKSKYRSLPFIASSYKSIIFFVKLIFRERFLLSSKNSYFKSPAQNQKYIYFPLHLIPESSTLIKAPFYPSEDEIIKRLSKVMPLGWKVYIKEHGAMIGERPIKFYKELSRLSNVEFIKLNAFNDPKDWITNSEGVVTITGTSAFEAAMLGIPSIILGNTSFETIKGIYKLNSIDELGGYIQKFNGLKLENTMSCSKYIETIKKYGAKVGFTNMHNKCYQHLLDLENNNKINELFKSDIINLSSVFKSGIGIIETKYD